MANYLIKKQWGYQTCCPDEENTVGYYTFKDPENVEVYTEPNYDSHKLNKVLYLPHEQWKYNNADKLNLSLKEMNEKFGNVYTIENSDIFVGCSYNVWGWEKVHNKEEKTTWIRVDEIEDIWIPYEHYEYDSSDDEKETTNSQEDKEQCWGCLHNEPNQMAHQCCGY